MSPWNGRLPAGLEWQGPGSDRRVYRFITFLLFFSFFFLLLSVCLLSFSFLHLEHRDVLEGRQRRHIPCLAWENGCWMEWSIGMQRLAWRMAHLCERKAMYAPCYEVMRSAHDKASAMLAERKPAQREMRSAPPTMREGLLPPMAATLSHAMPLQMRASPLPVARARLSKCIWSV